MRWPRFREPHNEFENQGLEVNFPAILSTFHRPCLSLQQSLFKISPTCSYYPPASDTRYLEGRTPALASIQ